VDFICFDKSEIKDVKILKNSAKIAVEFITEQVNLLRNAEGKVIEGDENFIQKITDVWTFERSLNAQSNKWLLVSTKKSA
jgi:predicted lipid-binding transport protein (Tim44 family)